MSRATILFNIQPRMASSSHGPGAIPTLGDHDPPLDLPFLAVLPELHHRGVPWGSVWAWSGLGWDQGLDHELHQGLDHELHQRAVRVYVASSTTSPLYI